MRNLSAFDVIEIWERGEGRFVNDTALSLLSTAFTDKRLGEIANWSIGERDSRLLELRKETFGKKLDGFAECPDCSEQLEFSMFVDDINVTRNKDIGNEIHKLIVGDTEVEFRSVTGIDLKEVSAYAYLEDARTVLIERVVLKATHNGKNITPGKLPEGVMQALSESMAEYDPQAEIIIELNCPACGHVWNCLFDIASFFFKEAATEAKRLLNEVHILAESYGWKEDDILSMSPGRRWFYMERAGK